jgi:hypothetical protein
VLNRLDYIRADGKKVRRVREPSSSSSASMSDDASRKEASHVKEATSPGGGNTSPPSNFLGDGSRPTSSKKSGSATVAVDGRNATCDNNAMEGKIYIRPDGKKVRRVRKFSSSKPATVNGESPALGSFLSILDGEGTRRASGAAIVTGTTLNTSSLPHKSSEKGEIYINKDGKKVRRVRKVPTAPLGQTGNPCWGSFKGGRCLCVGIHPRPRWRNLHPT